MLRPQRGDAGAIHAARVGMADHGEKQPTSGAMFRRAESMVEPA
jgi:hypothetical protein